MGEKMKITRVEDLIAGKWYSAPEDMDKNYRKILLITEDSIFYAFLAGKNVGGNEIKKNNFLSKFAYEIQPTPEMLELIPDDPYTIRTKFKVGDRVSHIKNGKIVDPFTISQIGVSYGYGGAISFGGDFLELEEEPKFKVGDEVWFVDDRGFVAKHIMNGVWIENVPRFKTRKEALEYALNQEGNE